MSAVDWQTKSTAICKQIEQSAWFQQAKTVLVYLSVRQEPDLSVLWQNKDASRVWGLPRCVGQDLVWHQWHPQAANQLTKGAYGILEPLPTLPSLAAETVDLMVVPAIACDYNGYRLGYGGGFYDRLLSQPEWASIPTVGVVFDFAYLESLAVEPWDCPMQSVCTEKGWTLSIG
jgi:5-formyltetrahydrofolate cyclo-ligase